MAIILNEYYAKDKAIVRRMKLLVAITPESVAKCLFYNLAVKLSTEEADK